MVVGEAKRREFALGEEGNLEMVDKFCYLGDMIENCGGASAAVTVRVRCAWAKFRELMQVLTCRGASLRLKGKIYRACVQSVMVYGSETWPIRVEDVALLVRTERMMVRWMCGVSLKDRVPSVELLERLHIVDVAEVVRRGRLRWFGHVERKGVEDWVSACRDLSVVGLSGRDLSKGRGWKTWRECVNDDMKKLNLVKADAQDRTLWRAAIMGNRLTRASTDKNQNRRKT